MKMESRGPHFGGSPFSYDTGLLQKTSASVFAYTMIVNLQATLPAASFQHPSGPDGHFDLKTTPFSLERQQSSGTSSSLHT